MQKRQQAALKKARAWKRYKKTSNRRVQGISDRSKWERKSKREFLQLSAPTNFSLIRNPEETIKYLSQIQRAASKQRKVFIDLSGIEHLTSDAIAALISVIVKVQVPVRGNGPNNLTLREMFLDSGFFEHVTSAIVGRKSKQGFIRKEGSRSVDARTAKELIAFASSSIHAKEMRNPGVQRVFIECMGNTIEHASGSHRREGWWATVYCNSSKKKAYFTFVDTGVGIFRSVQISPVRAFFNRVGITSNAEILKRILMGDYPSSTGLPNRGNGLPGIFDAQERGYFSNLIIIANEVFADVANSKYSTLSQPFNGTFLYWEVSDRSVWIE